MGHPKEETVKNLLVRKEYIPKLLVREWIIGSGVNIPKLPALRDWIIGSVVNVYQNYQLFEIGLLGPVCIKLSTQMLHDACMI